MATHEYDNFTPEGKEALRRATNWRAEQAKVARLGALMKMNDKQLIGYGLGKLFLAPDSPIVHGGLQGMLRRAFHVDDREDANNEKGKDAAEQILAGQQATPQPVAQQPSEPTNIYQWSSIYDEYKPKPLELGGSVGGIYGR